jgi:hypothetical protein
VDQKGEDPMLQPADIGGTTRALGDTALPVGRELMAPQACPTCGGVPAGVQSTPAAVHAAPILHAQNSRPWVYAIGKLDAPLFPRISVEKEFVQAAGHVKTSGLTDREALYKVLSQKENKYLARQLCWIMSIYGQQTYIVVPQHSSDTELLIESIQNGIAADALDVVIGIGGPIAPPNLCNGLQLPIVTFEQLYSSTRGNLLRSIPNKKNLQEKEFLASAAEVFERIFAAADNAGNTDANRAVNYLALRDPAIYSIVAECHDREMTLTSIESHPWILSSARRVVEVIFTLTNRRNEFVEKYCARVDVNDLYPFLVSKLSQYYDH